MLSRELARSTFIDRFNFPKGLYVYQDRKKDINKRSK
jgi:hypothetical protein